MPKKKTYRKPKIIYQKEIETLAVVCSSAKEPPDGPCRTSVPEGCTNLYS